MPARARLGTPVSLPGLRRCAAAPPPARLFPVAARTRLARLEHQARRQRVARRRRSRRHARGPGGTDSGDSPAAAGRRGRRFAGGQPRIPGAAAKHGRPGGVDGQPGEHAVSRRGSSSTRCWGRAAKPTSSSPARRCCSAPATPWCVRRCAASGRSGRRSRCNRSASWWPWATTTRTTRPASWQAAAELPRRWAASMWRCGRSIRSWLELQAWPRRARIGWRSSASRAR